MKLNDRIKVLVVYITCLLAHVNRPKETRDTTCHLERGIHL
uniref:Bm1233 n=1 Tax=Brugia malayi TaxID=6279 RepID=A0A0J9XS17_BRUMA|nr:Bm1233 [Brugia malayi]